MTSIKIKPWIIDLPEYIPGRTIEEIKKKYKLDTVYKLASNENIFGPSPRVAEALNNALSEINYYPDSYNRDLREKLEEKTGLRKEQFLFGNGTDQIIEMVCDAILDKGKNIVIPDPTFLTYERSALKNNAGIIKIPLNDFRQDYRSITSAADRDTGIIFLTSPHNPTGTIISEEELKFILDNISPEVLVVLDEAYTEFVRKEDKFNACKMIDYYKNLMVMRTFSKIYGLAGLRIGYAVADEIIIKSVEKLVQPFVVNLLAQKAAIASLEDDEYINKNIDIIINEREKIFNFLNNNNIEYVKSYANFILIKTGKHTEAITEDLLRKGFIVRGGSFLGFPEYIRVTISIPEINEKFINTFSGIYKKYMGKT